MRQGSGRLGIVISDRLIGCGRNVAISLGSVHYRVSDPVCAVLAFVSIPLAFGLQVRFVIRRKIFHLLLCKIHLKIVIVFCGGV